MRPVGESINSKRTYSARRLAPVVDDYSALMGRLPTSRVEPPDPSPQGEAKAALLTKFLYSTYELSRMGYQQAQAGFFLSSLGDAVYVLEPEPSLLRVVWSVCSPRNCLPSFYHGYRRFELFDLMVSEVWSPSELRRQWGVVPDRDTPEACTVLTYISPQQRTVLIGTRKPVQVAHADWNLDFCPAVWVFNKVTGMMGMSDIGNSLEQQDFLDFCFNVWADGIVHMTYPMVGIKNPSNAGDNFVVGPGAPPVILQGDGDIIVRQTQGDPRALEGIIAQSLQDMHAATGSSQVRQEGQMRSSITTGRAVQSVQGPQSTRIEFKQQVLGEAIEAANSFTLALQFKAPFLREFKGPIFGRWQGQHFQEEFSAEEIDGWTRNVVTWQALVGMNQQQRMQVAAEGMQFKPWDDLQGREIAGVEDPLGMRKRIESQLLFEAQLQQQMQTPAQGQQGQPPGSPGQQQGASQPSMVFRPPGMALAGQQGQPGLNPDSLRKALQPLAEKLRGEVFMDTQVLITDDRDYSQVLAVVRALDPGAKVRAISAAKLPDTAVRVL